MSSTVNENSSVYDKCWDERSVENSAYRAYYFKSFDCERTTYSDVLLQTLSATAEGKYAEQEDIPYICFLWYMASTFIALVDYQEFEDLVRAEVDAISYGQRSELEATLFNDLIKVETDLRPLTAYGLWGRKMVLKLFVEIAALSVALWFDALRRKAD